MTKYKTMSFALVHMTIAFTVVYLMTGSLVLGGATAPCDARLGHCHSPLDAARVASVTETYRSQGGQQRQRHVEWSQEIPGSRDVRERPRNATLRVRLLCLLAEEKTDRTANRHLTVIEV